MYRLGLVSVSFRDKAPKEIISAVKSAGLTCIEWGSDVHAPKDSQEKLNEIAALQNKYGIDCCSYGTYFKLGVTPVGELQGYINAAKILGTNILRLWCGNKNSTQYTETEKQELFDICRTAAGIAEKNGVTLCMECHGGTYTNKLASAIELMQAVNSKSFRMYWQPNQFAKVEDNLCYAEKIAPYTEHIHVFNWDEKAKYPLEAAADIWKAYLQRLGDGRTLLLEFMPDDKIETLEIEADALRKIVGEA